MVAAGAEAIRPALAHRGRRVAAISLVFVAAGPIIASVIKEAYFGGASRAFAFVVGLLVGPSPELVRFGPWANGWSLLPSDDYRHNLIMFCITCALTTLVCWWIVQKFLVRPAKVVATA